MTRRRTLRQQDVKNWKRHWKRSRKALARSCVPNLSPYKYPNARWAHQRGNRLDGGDERDPRDEAERAKAAPLKVSAPNDEASDARPLSTW